MYSEPLTFIGYKLMYRTLHVYLYLDVRSYQVILVLKLIFLVFE